MDDLGGANYGEMRQVSIVIEGIEPEWSPE